MQEFDLAALEKALFTKSRKPRQDFTLKPGLSKQALYDEAKRLAKEYYGIYRKNLGTRHRGQSYMIVYGQLRQGRYSQIGDIEQVPTAVFEKLVVNGRFHMKSYHDASNTVIMQNPEIALEANLEGKTNNEVLNFVYGKRLKQIEQLLTQRVSSPEAVMHLNFDITMKPLLGQPFLVTVSHWTTRSARVDGIESYPKSEVEMVKLVHFLTHFEQVVDELNRQLDKVEIRKEGQCTHRKLSK